MNLSNLKIKQLERLYSKLYKEYSKTMGYQPWGLDWPTLHVLDPERYETMKGILKEIRSRGALQS